MSRFYRLFEIVQILRAAPQPVTAAELARRLEVTPRTVYRDMAALQARSVPVAGAAGIGYVMGKGFDLPPLAFSAEEADAIAVGLALVRRTGDQGLEKAAAGAAAKIAAVAPPPRAGGGPDASLYASPWGVEDEGAVGLADLRKAISDEVKLGLDYCDGAGRPTARTVWPIALVYYAEVAVLAAWCELRQDFRHFRADRILACARLDEPFGRRGRALRAEWRQLHGIE